MTELQLIILTKSSKFSGYCVAGIEVNTGAWYRLVTTDENSYGAVGRENLQYEDGRECQLLDEVIVPIDEKCRDDIQPENVLLNTSYYLTFVRKVTLAEVLEIHTPEVHNSILGNQYPYITSYKIGMLDHSLELIKAGNIRAYQTTNNSGEPKTKADFYYYDVLYQGMSVTDYRYYGAANTVLYNEAYLVISIGTPYNGRHYKFISAIYV